jgi:tetratricopeptide (TPR) repeat protein
VPTLYELLEALPEDDSDGLRAAFRKAVKAHHPDNNPDDPDAAQRFRRVVRAHAILSDDQQRATYDACLVNAQQQQRARSSKRYIFSKLRRLAPDVVSCLVIAFMSIAAFLLVEKVATMRVAPAQVQGISVPASALAAAMPAQPSDTVGRAAEHSKLDHVQVANAPAAPDAVREIPAPVAVATADNAGVVSATTDVVVKDARYYRDRGGVAYRGGDLPLALIDFDLAINLDPNSAEAYADRAIVFRRMGDMKRALADVAEAKRVGELRPQQTAPLSGSD